jgi:hypothetical protein
VSHRGAKKGRREEERKRREARGERGRTGGRGDRRKGGERKEERRANICEHTELDRSPSVP